MHYLIIADAYPPIKSSVAVQIKHLEIELISSGHNVTLLIPDSEIKEPYKVVVDNNFECKVVHIQVKNLKSKNKMIRAISEILMPVVMINKIKKYSLLEFNNTMNSIKESSKFDGLIWYSPSIFHGLLVKYLKSKYNCKSYLIIRDIFPEWALDLGIIKKGLIYYFFRSIANFQYLQANTIGVQSPGNLVYFSSIKKNKNINVEVLNNWLVQEDDPTNLKNCSIIISNTKLSNRDIFVYSGNMGIAQGMDILIELANEMKSNEKIGFLFVGRGTEMERLKIKNANYNLHNTLFFDEIDPSEMTHLYEQCSVGLISLDLRHKSHNIPGKFINYMRSGLPVVASINPDNDLINIVKNEGLGETSSNGEVKVLAKKANDILHKLKNNHDDLKLRCNTFYKKNYDAKIIVKQITKSF
jgi:glycosyltransferase involved in cell wall biosynthesis